MNHAVLTEHLADYLEGDLALDKRALVDAHLDSCEICAQEVREMQQTIRLLRALPQPEVPPMIAANVMRRIRAGETRPSLFERAQRIFGGVLEPSFVLPASAVAVAALVFVVIQGGGPLSRSLLAEEGAAAVVVREDEMAGLAAEAELGAQLAAQEVDRTFGASAVEETDEAPRVRDRLETSRESAVAASTPASAPMPIEEPSVERSTGDAEPATALAARDPMAGLPWASPRRRPANSPSRRAEAFFGNGGLAQGFASDVSGPATGFATRSSGDGATAVPVTLSRRTSGDPTLAADAGGEDPRDVWLARALEHPAEFARYIARHNLAEQELWVERLGERAESRGLLGELIEALRSAGDEKASWLADDFAAQASDAASGAAPAEVDESGAESSR
ncbi:MAG: zf-HC2 domain-containing protein [Deltaproteobacteria bacterium]|nr:zf-HC2 domain-containing protein [Deltaproteobacteria bacterium]